MSIEDLLPPPPVIYFYHPSSGLLLGEGRADPDPMQPGQWLMPANATPESPLTQAQGQVVVFKQSAWHLLPDQRGTWYDESGQAVQITDVQADVAGLVRVAPPSADHVLSEGQWQISEAKVQARFQAAKAGLLSQARAQREIVLNRLMGIAFAAEKLGDSATVNACMTARQSLLDLTKHTTITSASNEPQIKSAYKSLYGAIVAATPAAIRSVYSDIQV
jgi:hypothetical protein